MNSTKVDKKKSVVILSLSKDAGQALTRILRQAQDDSLRTA